MPSAQLNVLYYIRGSYRKSWATFFLHANQEQQTESMVVDGTSCCVILECLVTSIACITWPVSLLTKWPTMICHFTRVLSSNFLLEEIPAAEIHQRLQCAYGSVCMGDSSVQRWVKHFKDGNTSIQDQPRSGRPRTASTERDKERVDEIIQDDRCVTVDTIARTLGIRHNAVQEMIESLGYRKVCARWIPRLLTEDHKGQRKAITSELLQRYRHKGDDLLLRNLLLVMSRHCTSSVVHCATNVQDKTSSCMTTLAPTPLASNRKQLQRWGGKFFHTPPIALTWHPPTIFSDLWRISCAHNVMRQRTQFRKQHVSVFGWLEWNFTEGEHWENCVQRSGNYVEKKKGL